MPRTSFLLSLLETLLITAGGFLLVSLFARAATMSGAELVIGPLAVALVWLGMSGIHPKPSR